ncbi:MAG: very short patch repair endonuclease [Brevinematales bacterium]|nr:very short patch repair endonuclease [Brevinematales bacterium]
MVRTPEVTHKIMSAIKQKNTKPEILLRKALWRKGLRYRVNVTKLPGRPDVVFTKARITVFCDGDFWHGHNWAIRGIPSLEDELAGYSEFWRNKILGNIKRDKETTEKLIRDGWLVLRFWESDIIADADKCADSVVEKWRERRN